MRVVWLLGGKNSHIQQLQSCLSKERTLQSYVVRQADKISQIPEDHLNEKGVILLLDAFSPNYMGFAGIEELAKVSCKARCFLLGEPAKEQSVEPFAHEFFSGYFPPLDRIDFDFLAGVVHHSLFLNGKIEIKNFLSSSGKSSVEEIASLSDFLHFEKLLRVFATKFGIDGAKLRKLVMAMTLQHTKNADGKVAISEKYPIYFGIDPKKLVVAVPTMSRGYESKELRAEFTRALSSLSESKVPSASMCPELFHSVQSGESLLFFAGSTKSEEALSDPCFLVTRIHFPKKETQESSQGYAYCQHQVVKTDEHDEHWAKMEINSQQEIKEPSVEAPAEIELEPEPALMSTDDEDVQALQSILDEPVVSGDPLPPPSSLKPQRPKAPEMPSIAVSQEQEPQESTQNSNFSMDTQGDARTWNLAIYELNQVCTALSKDVHSLMKSRREPSTDKELRAEKAKLEANVKRLSGEIQKYQKTIQGKDTEIEELKERIKRLMTQVQNAA
ncbi:hypothetical protein GW915_02870 [bacterium]|nr:hypothetical protein [bacterium]